MAIIQYVSDHIILNLHALDSCTYTQIWHAFVFVLQKLNHIIYKSFSIYTNMRKSFQDNCTILFHHLNGCIMVNGGRYAITYSPVS